MDREPVLAEEATAARNWKRHHDSASTVKIRYRGADLFHDAQELVSHDQHLRLRQNPLYMCKSDPQIAVEVTSRLNRDKPRV
jgi:hypothetical protein